MTSASDPGNDPIGAAATRGAGQTGTDRVERALVAAADDPGRIIDVLTELSRARIWVPLPPAPRPGDQGPIRSDGAVRLPTVTFQGGEFVPVFTSIARMLQWAETSTGHGQQQPDQAAAEGGLPHLVVPAAALAQLLPARCGIAVNPDAGPSIALSPDGVADLAEAVR